MEHSFDIEIAKEYGIEEAILLKNLYHWTEKNRANNKHFHDGEYWTYNSSKAFSTMFPYMSERTILRKLSNLQEKGLILISNFNETKYDRTQWYALTRKAISLIEKVSDKIANPSDNLANGNAQNGGPIPNNKTNKNTDIIKGYAFNEQVETAILDWLDYKKEKKQEYKPKGLETLLKKLKHDCFEHGNQYVIESITNSIMNNYAGIFPPKQFNNFSFGRAKQTTDTSKVDKNGVISL